MGSETGYMRLFEAAENGLLILDPQTGTILDVNPWLAQLLDYAPSELRGKALWEIGRPEDVDASKRMFLEMIAKRDLRCGNLPLLTKSGRLVGVEFAANLHRLNGADAIHCSIRCTGPRADTDRQELDVRQTHKMDAVGQVAGGVAHDLNSLLGVILGCCESLEAEAELPEPARKLLLDIHNAGSSARNLTRSLLTFSCGQLPQPVALNLNESVSRMEELLGRLIGDAIELVSLPGRDLGSIEADPNQIERVLMNLVINARDAMPNGGKIVIETANVEIDETNTRLHPALRPGRYVMLTVSDTGIGMDQEVQSHIFEPFFSTKPSSQGTGLGLSTVFRIVKRCKGTIAVYSKAGAGTTLKIRFPRCDEALIVPQQQQVIPMLAGTETILLVDDSSPLRKLMRQFLADRGYQVLDTGDPAEALRMAAESPVPIPLLITDRVLPGFNGTVLAEKLIAARPETKVLYISGYNDDLTVPSRILGRDYDFLVKPFTQKELLAKARQLLDSSH
jgi:PAS domain S-box-containing protein